jgi:hypothetical protein
LSKRAQQQLPQLSLPRENIFRGISGISLDYFNHFLTDFGNDVATPAPISTTLDV